MPALHTRTRRQAQVLYALTTKSAHTRPEGRGCPRMVWMGAVGQCVTGGHGKWARECQYEHGRLIFCTYGRGTTRAKTTTPNMGGEKGEKSKKNTASGHLTKTLNMQC